MRLDVGVSCECSLGDEPQAYRLQQLHHPVRVGAGVERPGRLPSSDGVGEQFAIISRVGTGTPYLLMLAGLIPLGVGMGAAMTPATAAITEALPQAQQGVGSALNDLSREVGGALGTAVIGSIVTAVYRSHLQLRGVPAPLVNKAQQSFAIAIHTGGPVGAHARTAFVDGIHIGLLYAAGAALLGAISVATLLSRQAKIRQPADQGERSQLAYVTE